MKAGFFFTLGIVLVGVSLQACKPAKPVTDSGTSSMGQQRPEESDMVFDDATSKALGESCAELPQGHVLSPECEVALKKLISPRIFDSTIAGFVAPATGFVSTGGGDGYYPLSSGVIVICGGSYRKFSWTRADGSHNLDCY